MGDEVLTPAPVQGKSPLTSTTLQTAFVALVAALVGFYYPPAGDWLKAHNSEVLGVLSTAVTVGRGKASQPIDWKNWTIGSIGFKF